MGALCFVRHHLWFSGWSDHRKHRGGDTEGAGQIRDYNSSGELDSGVSLGTSFVLHVLPNICHTVSRGEADASGGSI